MMKKRYVFVILLVLLMVSYSCKEEDTPTQVQPSTGDLEGRVYWGNWNGISGARVCIATVECTISDDRAWYVFEDIPEGNYMITASASGYVYYQGSVRILPDNSNQFHIQLEPEAGLK